MIPLLARQFGSTFGFSGTVKEYLTFRSPFAIFEPYIWRRFGPFAACYYEMKQTQTFQVSPAGSQVTVLHLTALAGGLVSALTSPPVTLDELAS